MKVENIMRIKILVCALSVLLAVGCLNPLGGSKTETGTSKATEEISSKQNLAFERMTRVSAPSSMEISIPVTGLSSTLGRVSPVIYQDRNKPVDNVTNATENVIKINIPSASESSTKATLTGGVNSKGITSSEYSFISDISLGGKIILISLGLLLLYFFVFLVRKKYKSVDFVFGKIDEATVIAEGKIVKRLETLREKSLNSTDPTENARLASEIASLNDDRGKLKAEIFKLKSEIKT